VVQFGINAKPEISKAWTTATIPDDAVTQSNKLGYVTFATGGPNTRTTQIFINLADNTSLDGQGFSPFGQVIEGMDVVTKFFSGYGEQITSLQGQIEAQGNAFLKASFPNLDTITSAVIEPPPGAVRKPAAAHASHAVHPATPAQ
jgi:peptidyl-prolyl cis-trans isomerase A (cyclophilin A)